MNGIIVNCDQCNWTIHAPDADLAVHWGNLHQQQMHGLSPENLSAADAIIDTLLADDAATDLLWLNTLTLEDAAFLIEMNILPT